MDQSSELEKGRSQQAAIEWVKTTFASEPEQILGEMLAVFDMSRVYDIQSLAACVVGLEENTEVPAEAKKLFREELIRCLKVRIAQEGQLPNEEVLSRFKNLEATANPNVEGEEFEGLRWQVIAETQGLSGIDIMRARAEGMLENPYLDVADKSRAFETLERLQGGQPDNLEALGGELGI